MIDNENTPQPLAEIAVGPSEFEQFLDRNQKRLIALAILVILLGAAVVVYKSLKEDAESRAAAALVLSFDETTRKYDVASLEKVKAEHAGTHAAQSADYLRAQALWLEGKSDEAISALQTFLHEYGRGPLYDKASLELAMRYHQNGDKDKALEAYRKVIETSHSVYAPLALMNMGDIFRAENETEKAKACYEEALSKYPNSSFSYTQDNANEPPSAVARRLALLGVKDPEIVPVTEPLDTQIISPQGGNATPAVIPAQ